MKKSFFVGLSVVALLGLFSCTGNKKAETTETTTEQVAEATPEWAGLYEGTLPCADCEGVKTTLTLNADSTYTCVAEYLGKGGEPFTETGLVVWAEDGINFSLTAESKTTLCRIVEGGIAILDAEGKLVEGDLAPMYILAKK